MGKGTNQTDTQRLRFKRRTTFSTLGYHTTRTIYANKLEKDCLLISVEAIKKCGERGKINAAKVKEPQNQTQLNFIWWKDRKSA